MKEILNTDIQSVATNDNQSQVSVLIISHDDIGTALLKTATNTLGELPLVVTVVDVEPNTDPDDLIPKLKQLISSQLNDRDVLILTDMFGATPSNIANTLQQTFNHIAINIVTGLNLPMLLRVMNYPTLSLAALAEKAVSGGRDGVCLNQS